MTTNKKFTVFIGGAKRTLYLKEDGKFTTDIAKAKHFDTELEAHMAGYNTGKSTGVEVFSA